MTSQCQVLNKILDTKDFSLLSMNDISEEFFSNYINEYNYIKNHYEVYGVVPDKETFLTVFENFEVIKVNEPNSFLLEQLYKDYHANYLAEKFNSIKKHLESGDTEEAMRVLTTAVEGVKTGAAITCTNLLTDRSRFEHFKDRVNNTNGVYYKTGFDEIDATLGGIDPKNENMIIAARTGKGKTQLLLKMATAASAQHLTVGIYEGEMSMDKIGYRIDTFIGHMDNTALNRGYADVLSEYKNYIDSLQLRGYGPIKTFTPNDVPGGSVTVDTIEAFINREHIDIMFIDQYDLMDDKHKGKTYPERLANIAADIKKLQVKLQKPIISVSQFNRTKNEDGSKDTSQIAGSDMIPRYATILLALDQEYTDKAIDMGTGMPRKEVYLLIDVIKGRDGGDGSHFKYKVDFNRGYFNYVSPAAQNEKDAEAERKGYETGIESNKGSDEE